jgi:hypothetical protein
LGNKPLGRLSELREDESGAFYEVDLLDTPYNDEFVIPAARAGLLGSSFRFSVPEGGETWTRRPERSAHNPEGLPERTVIDTALFELGPVTFPAYAGASAGVRSAPDDFIDSLTHDPRFMARFIERVGPGVVERVLDSLPPTAQEAEPSEPVPPTAPVARDNDDDSTDGQPSEADTSFAARQQMRRRITADRLGIGKEK